MDSNLRAKFEAARDALFALEEALGPLGSANRQLVYSLRSSLNTCIGPAVMRQEKEEKG